jgi:hypothetical protein
METGRGLVSNTEMVAGTRAPVDFWLMEWMALSPVPTTYINASVGGALLLLEPRQPEARRRINTVANEISAFIR